MGGRLVLKEAPRVVSERDDRLVAEHDDMADVSSGADIVTTDED